MTHIAETVRCLECATPSMSAGGRLLAHLSSLLRRHLSRLDPEELPPHLRRDLGLADHGFPGGRYARPIDWLR